ncbi:hypothetical protein Hanom_Chr02g00173691 [Helianthus anomalus]
MEPIKSNHHPSQYPPLDLAEIKSQPLKLIKITSVWQFIEVSWPPHFLAHVLPKSLYVGGS